MKSMLVCNVSINHDIFNILPCGCWLNAMRIYNDIHMCMKTLPSMLTMSDAVVFWQESPAGLPVKGEVFASQIDDDC